MDEEREGEPAAERRARGGRKREPARRRSEQSSKPPIAPAADPRRSRSLEYGAAMLQCFSGDRQAIGIAELASMLGISRSTTHRYATTLLTLGCLEQDDKRRYRLAGRAADLGRVAIGALRLEVGARAVLEELRGELGHTVSLGVLSGTRAIYVYRLFGHRRGQYEIDRGVESGASVPLHCAALGKAMLASLPPSERKQLLDELALEPHGPNAVLDRRRLEAELERIGPAGTALSNEEQWAGARSIAVLVPPSWRWRHTLAVEVTVPAEAYSASRLLKQAGPLLRRAAKQIAAD